MYNIKGRPGNNTPQWWPNDEDISVQKGVDISCYENSKTRMIQETSPKVFELVNVFKRTGTFPCIYLQMSLKTLIFCCVTTRFLQDSEIQSLFLWYSKLNNFKH